MKVVGVLISVLFFVGSGYGQPVKLVIPIVINGWADEDLAFDTSIDVLARNHPSRADLEGFTDQGEPMNVGNSWGFASKVGHSFPWNGVPGRFRIYIGHSPRPPDTGWISVTIYGSDQFKLYATIELKGPDGLLNVTSVPAVAPAEYFVMPLMGPKTSYAIVNPSESEEARVVLDARKPDEAEGCMADLIIPPRHRVARFFDELFELPCEYGTVVQVTSDVPVGVGVLDVVLPEFKFNGLPVD
jgi:hypothetical protein